MDVISVNDAFGFAPNLGAFLPAQSPMRDLHFTIMNSVFGMGATNFGQNLTSAPIAVINQIVA